MITKNKLVFLILSIYVFFFLVNILKQYDVYGYLNKDMPVTTSYKENINFEIIQDNILLAKKKHINKNIILISGDSFAEMYLPSFYNMKYFDSLIYTNFLKCFLLGKSINDLNIKFNSCQKNNDEKKLEILKNFFKLNPYKNKFIFFNTAFFLEKNFKNLKIKSFKKNFETLINHFPDFKFVFFYPPTLPKYSTKYCLIAIKLNFFKNSFCEFPKKSINDADLFLKKLQKEYAKNIFLIDISYGYCTKNNCSNYNMKNNFFVFELNGHVTSKFSKHISEKLENLIKD